MWKSLVHSSAETTEHEAAILRLLQDLGATEAEIQKHRVAVTRNIELQRSSLTRLRKRREAEKAYKAANEGRSGAAMKRARRRTPWRAKNIVTMAEIEKLPVELLVDLFLANLPNVSGAPPTNADFAIAQEEKAIEDKRTVYDRFVERGPRKVRRVLRANLDAHRSSHSSGLCAGARKARGPHRKPAAFCPVAQAPVPAAANAGHGDIPSRSSDSSSDSCRPLEGGHNRQRR